MRRWVLTVGLLTAALGLAGCGDDADAARPNAGADGKPVVVAAFYPLQFVAARVTGADVTSLTRPGAEPHDLELRPRDVATAHDASLLL